jgi:hypothetical protein
MILLLLVRSGHSVDGMAYERLSPSGEFVMHGEPGPDAEKSPTSGVEIEFHRRNDSTSRTLYYFSTDLAAGFGRDPRFPRFLHRFGMCDTLLKSASFLPHWRMCDSIRNYILENSNLVLQDDTGGPFRGCQRKGGKKMYAQGRGLGGGIIRSPWAPCHSASGKKTDPPPRMDHARKVEASLPS